MAQTAKNHSSVPHIQAEILSTLWNPASLVRDTFRNRQSKQNPFAEIILSGILLKSERIVESIQYTSSDNFLIVYIITTVNNSNYAKTNI